MKIQTKFFLLLIFLSVIVATGTIVPGYFILKSLELSDARAYSLDRISQLSAKVDRSYEVLERAGVLEIESYILSSKEAVIKRFVDESSDRSISSFIFDTEDNIIIAKSEEFPMEISEQLMKSIKHAGSGSLIHTNNNSIWHVVFDNKNRWDWCLVAAMSEKEVYRDSSTYLTLVLSFSFFVLIFVLLIYWTMTNRARKKLNTMIVHLANYKRGQYKKRIEVTSSDEIGILGNHINSMIENIANEISARKNTEIALESAKSEAESANNAKSEFLANMSHEIRNPLNAIVGFSEILSTTNLDEKQRGYERKISHASQLLTAMLSDILDITKIEHRIVELNRDYFDFREEIYTTFDLFSLQGRKKGLEMICNIDDGVPDTVYGDKLLCSQIVNNLIQNSMKFTSTGSIKLNIKLVKETISFYLLQLEVEDTGIGIAEEQQKGIFDIFSQAHIADSRENNGIGLGLAIVNGIVKAMDGSISVSSVPGQGSIFSATLPFEKIDQDSILDSMMSINSFSDSEVVKVLVAEDDQLNREYIAAILSSRGLNYVLAENGFDAVERMKNESFDIVLMDVRMPGMSGDEAIVYIRNNMPSPTNSIPIIILTANAFRNDVKRYIEIGATSYLLKPFDPDKLVKLIRKLTIDLDD